MGNTKLIGALEGADGADEWCDYHLWRIATPSHNRWTIGGIGSLDGVPLWGDPRKDRDWDKSPPAYTASIDDALTLLPKGWTFISLGRDPYEEDAFCVTIYDRSKFNRHREFPDGSVFTGHAATPALAICIAALKART